MTFRNRKPTWSSRPRRPGLRAWLLLAPMVTWMLVFVVAPTAILLVYSFCQYDDLGEIQYAFTWDNYQRIFDPSYLGLLRQCLAAGAIGAGAALAAIGAWRLYQDGQRGLGWRWRWAARTAIVGFILGACVFLHFRVPRLGDEGTYLKTLWRSIEYAALATAICLLAGYPVAWWIGRSPPRRRGRLLFVVMIPFWTSFLIRVYAWMTLLSHNGLINSVLSASGLVPHLFPHPLDILYTPTAVMIGLVYSYLPFMILPIYGSVEKLDASLVEQALDLGANPWRAFTSVIWPLTRAGAAAGVMLVFVPAIGMFAIPDLLGGARTPMIGNVIENQFHAAQDWPFGAALGITLLALFTLAYVAGARGSAQAREA